MQPDDTTTRKVHRILREGAEHAYDWPRPDRGNDPTCGCGHGNTAHHGKDGELHCGEDDCRCAAFHEPYPLPCPDCTTGTWDDVAGRCNGCGLTIETIAERFAR